VRVKVKRNPDLAVAQALAGDFGVDAGSQHMGGMAVPQIVEADALQSTRPDEGGKSTR
jgi:hypothetical protein